MPPPRQRPRYTNTQPRTYSVGLKALLSLPVSRVGRTCMFMELMDVIRVVSIVQSATSSGQGALVWR
jgi:hypothetical protein